LYIEQGTRYDSKALKGEANTKTRERRGSIFVTPTVMSHAVNQNQGYPIPMGKNQTRPTLI